MLCLLLPSVLSKSEIFYLLTPVSMFLNSQLSFGLPPFGRVPSFEIRNSKLPPYALCSMPYASFTSYPSPTILPP